MTCKTLGEAAAPTIAAAIDSVHRAKVAALQAELATAIERGQLLPAAGVAGSLSRALVGWYCARRDGAA